jgi:DNA-binding NtrC family response regulator
MNGLQLIDQMEKNSLIPIILMSNQPMEDMSTKVNKTDARAIISKPNDFSKLLEEVGRQLGNSRQSGPP